MLLPTLTLTLLGVLALGFWVFASAPGRRENQAFAAFTWVAACWVANDLSFWGFQGLESDGVGWARRAFLIAIALQVVFLHFSWVFPTPRPIPWGRAGVSLAPLLGLVPLVVWGQPVAHAGFSDGAFSIGFTPWTFVIGGYVYLLFALARVVVIAKRRAEADDPELQRHLGVLLLSPLVTGLFTTVVIVALPLLGIYALLPYASLGILGGAVIHSHAALNLRFLKPASGLDELRLFPVTAKLALAVAGLWALTVVLVLGVVQLQQGGSLRDPVWQQAWALGLVAGSLPAMALILIAQKIVARPLQQVSEAALEVARGRTDVRVELGGGRDEVTLLAESFNAMVARLERDLQLQRETAQTLLRTERLAVAGSLAAGVAHEVNNPLAAISSLVQTAQQKTEDEQARKLLGDALGHMDRIATALKDLLTFARAPATPQRVDCRLREVVEATVGLLRYDTRFRAIDLQFEHDAELGPVSADPHQLQQVLLNLLLNARDAIETRRAAEPAAPATIAIRTAAHPEGQALAIADSGCGIPEADQARLGEPFFTTKPVGSGTGLGLTVCRDLLRMNDGRLRIESEPGQGTTVTAVFGSEETE